MNKYLKLALCFLPPLVAGSFAGISTATNVNNWYSDLVKPVFNPPNYLFGPVWTILYVLMGISFFIIMKSPSSPQRTKATFIYWLQLILNFCWSFIFFKFHWIGFAFLEIVILWLCILTMIFRFEKLNKRAAYLQLPYLGWVLFASILNGSIWWLN
ncbi:MAG: tryptophan-rich sensory protein [Bacteroidia bacterium]|nr:tryptophan-rich sensory protein [Bacteroidia bacterium]